jgi:hypothetical protein
MSPKAQERFWKWAKVVAPVLASIAALSYIIAKSQSVDLNSKAIEKHGTDHRAQALDEAAHRKEVRDSLTELKEKQAEQGADVRWIRKTLEDLQGP